MEGELDDYYRKQPWSQWFKLILLKGVNQSYFHPFFDKMMLKTTGSKDGVKEHINKQKLFK